MLMAQTPHWTFGYGPPNGALLRLGADILHWDFTWHSRRAAELSICLAHPVAAGKGTGLFGMLLRIATSGWNLPITALQAVRDRSGRFSHLPVTLAFTFEATHGGSLGLGDKNSYSGPSLAISVRGSSAVDPTAS
jgi:hypothetical protein